MGVAGLALALAACGGSSDAPTAAPAAQVPSGPTPRHLVFVTIDTLRADRLGTYGGPVPTPAFDRLAAEGLLARDVSAHVALTLPAHATIFTGRLPPQHGLRDNVAPPLPEDLPTLAETLQATGFRTGGFVSSIVVGSRTGLNRGFDAYDDAVETPVDGAGRFLSGLHRQGDVTLEHALGWLESDRAAHPQARRFAWIHLYDPHEPYEPPEPWASRYPERPYDGEVAWSDELVRRLHQGLERLDMLGDSLLVVTADHGEGLGDHDEALHGFFVYETTLRVPLVARGPGIPAGLKLEHTVRGIDLRPTLLAMLGVPDPAPGPGRSLAGAWRGAGEPDEPPVYAESLQPKIHFGWSELRSLREGRYKFIEAPRPELYDVVADPGETDNLIQRQGARATALRDALAEQIEGLEAAASNSTAPAVSAEVRAQLGALGYLGGTGTAPDPGADPKDKIEDFRKANATIRFALLRFDAGDFDAAVGAFLGMLQHGIDSFEIRYYLGRALVGAKRFREALPHLERAVELQPALPEAWEVLADAHVALGDTPSGIAAIARGREALPRDAGLPRQLARLERAAGRLPEAARALEDAVALAPDDALIHVQLGEAYRDLRRVPDAIAQMREAVRLDPKPASYWNSLGMVLGLAQDWDGALGAFQEAIRREPRQAQYVYNAALVHQRTGQRQQAIDGYRQVLAIDPGFAAAQDRLAEIGAGPPRVQEAPGPPS